MILEQDEAEDRLNSSDNLLNKLRLATTSDRGVRKDFAEMYGIREAEVVNPVLPPSAEELVGSLEDKIQLGLAYAGATNVLNESIAMLSRNLPNVDPTKPALLARIAVDMNRIVTGINEVRNGGKNQSSTQVIIYRPVMMNENHYETVHAHE